MSPKTPKMHPKITPKHHFSHKHKEYQTKNKKTYKPEQKPGYLEYKNMGHEFRPFILFSNEENYKTDRVNTDKFGFRKTGESKVNVVAVEPSVDVLTSDGYKTFLPNGNIFLVG